MTESTRAEKAQQFVAHLRELADTTYALAGQVFDYVGASCAPLRTDPSPEERAIMHELFDHAACLRGVASAVEDSLGDDGTLPVTAEFVRVLSGKTTSLYGDGSRVFVAVVARASPETIAAVCAACAETARTRN